MLRPSISMTETDENEAVLYVLNDSSASMGTPDGPNGQTRRAALLRTLEECSPQFDDLAEEVDVRFADFDEELTSIEIPEDESDGKLTAIGEVLDGLLKSIRDQRVAGIVMLSDGAERTVGDTLAARTVASRFGEAQLPIYTVPYGGSGIGETATDVAIEDMLVDREVFEKNVVPVTTRIRAMGAAGRELTVRLMLENRIGTVPGQTGPYVRIPITSETQPVRRVRPKTNNELIPIELSFIPEISGEYKLAVEVDPIDAEIKAGNNRRETIIKVRGGGIRVAYFDWPRAEAKFIRKQNSANRIQLDFQPARLGKLAEQNQISEELFFPGTYDVYIIGDVPYDIFGRDLLNQLADCVDQGAGLLMTGGYNSFGPGGYGRTRLADLLPVFMRRDDYRPDGAINPSMHFQESLKIVPTPAGLRHTVMQIDPEGKNQARWAELEPLERGNRLQAKEGLVNVLAEANGHPMLVAQDLGTTRTAAFAGDTTWQWVTVNDEAEAHQRFWRQMILWLARKDIDTDQAVWAKVEPRNFAAEQPVTIQLGARNEEGVAISDAEFTVDVSDPKTEVLNPSVRAGSSGITSVYKETRTPGDYWVKVDARQNGESLGPLAWTRFIVDSRDPELDNPAADHALLEDIATLSGGDTLPPEKLADRLTDWLKAGIPNLAVERETTIPLWDNWPFLMIFVGLICTEWFVRKRRGLV